jgi:hypothetical protein
MTYTPLFIRITLISLLLSGWSITAANAATVIVDLSSATTGTLINAPGASFAQTFSGQTVDGTGIVGSPSGPLTLSATGLMIVVPFSPICAGCNSGNSILSQPGNQAPLSILFDQQADSLSWVMGQAMAPSSVTIDLFAGDGSLVNTLSQALVNGYSKYTISGLGTFAGLTFKDNNDLYGGLRFMDFSYNAVPAVPVPAAIWLFGTALIGLVGFGKRKSRIAS